MLGNVKKVVLQIEPFNFCFGNFFVPPKTGIKTTEKDKLEHGITISRVYKLRDIGLADPIAPTG